MVFALGVAPTIYIITVFSSGSIGMITPSTPMSVSLVVDYLRTNFVFITTFMSEDGTPGGT